MKQKGREATTESIGLHRFTLAGIKLHGAAAYPQECCGLLFGKKAEDGQWKVTDALPLENVAVGSRKAGHYMADPKTVYALEKTASKRGVELLGIYHSHPDCEAVLSVEDEEGMLPDQVYVVLSVRNGKCRGFRAWKKGLYDEKAGELAIAVSSDEVKRR